MMWRQEDHEFETSPGKVSEILSQKQNTNKMVGRIAQEVEYLHCKLNTLDLILSTGRKRKKNRIPSGNSSVTESNQPSA
jgi:hypothetical protein